MAAGFGLLGLVLLLFGFEWPAWAEMPSEQEAERTVTVLFPELLTYSAREGQKPNIQVALELILANAGLPGRITVMPESRAIEALEQDRRTCRYFRLNVPSTEGKAVVGTLVVTTQILAARPGLNPDIHQLADARPYHVGIAMNRPLQESLERLGISVEPVRLDSLNMAKLQVGRIDLWSTTRSGLERFVKAGLGPMSNIVWESGPIEFGIYCNAAFPESMRQALEKSLTAFRLKHKPDLSDLD